MTKARDLANLATAGATVSATELGYVDGVTSAIQAQLNAKAALTNVAAITTATTIQTNTAFSQVPVQVVLQASINNFQIGSMGSFTSGDLAIFNNAFPVGSVVTISGSAGTNEFTVASAATIGGGNINCPITTAASGFIFYSGNATLVTGVSTTGKYLTNNGTSASWEAIVTDPTPSIFLLMGA